MATPRRRLMALGVFALPLGQAVLGQAAITSLRVSAIERLATVGVGRKLPRTDDDPSS